MARPDLDAVRSLPEQAEDAAAVLSRVRLAAARLLILLGDRSQRDVAEADLETVENWVVSWLSASSSADRTDVPSTRPVLDLARELVTEPAPAGTNVPARLFSQGGE